MLSFTIEPFSNLIRDGQEIFPVHYEELALHKEQIPLGMDFDLYLFIESQGKLLTLCARENGKLIGYYIAIVIANHPHNKTAGKVATCDMFYILPAHRKGGAGAKLLMAAEQSLRAHGVRKASLSTKVKFQSRPLLESLGWEHTDVVFQKVLL